MYIVSTMWGSLPPMTVNGSLRLLVKVTAGQGDAERCAQAFTVAATAVASGVETSLWLTGDAAWFALPGRAADFELAGSAPLEDLLETVLAMGTVTVCTQCAERRGFTAADCLAGIRIAGAAAFVEEAVTPGTQALVY